MMNPPMPPAPSFPSPYARPSTAPSRAEYVTMADGAQIAAFLYEPSAQESNTKATMQAVRDTVLFLHGNGGEHGSFGPVIDAVLERGCTALALDSRAQGRSTRGSERLTYELMTADAVAVMDAFGISAAHVLGYSDGGIEALLLARDYPERVLSVLALGANLTPDGVVEDPNWDITGSVATHRAWADYWLGESRADGEQHVDTRLLTPTPEQALWTAELLQLMLDEPHIEATSLSSISQPITIMVGEHDCIADYETTTIVSAIAQARLVVVPEVGHSIPKQAPYAIIRELNVLISAVHAS
ncbi:MAG: alpha/beta fold hydrolase [Atopobiaceae bacterium]|nr:alpha/beta fold hydrolase [Atopobiaceae bacterium]